MTFCSACGQALRGADSGFCHECGHPLESERGRRPPAASPADGPKAEPASKAAPIKKAGQAVQSAAAGYVTVAAVCTLVSIVGWTPLSLPSRVLNGFLGRLALWRICTTLETGSTSMFGCSAGVGIATVVVGPLLTALVLYVFRKQLSVGIQFLLSRVQSAQHLTAPIVATAVFLVAWAGTHFETWAEVGLLPNMAFPAAVGLFAHWSSHNSAEIQSRYSGFLAQRDRLSAKVRLGLSFVITTLFAIQLASILEGPGNRVAYPTFHQQIVVLVGLLIGYAAMVPRRGDPLQDARRLARKMGVGA